MRLSGVRSGVTGTTAGPTDPFFHSLALSGGLSRGDRPGLHSARVAEILEYQNDDVRRQCLLRLDSGEILSIRFSVGAEVPFLRVARLAPETCAEAEILWELAEAASNRDTLLAQFGEPPVVPAPALPMLDAAVRSLRECRSVIQVKHRLEKTIRFRDRL